MHSHTYKVVEIVSTSTKGLEDAIRSGIARASESLRHVRWFEVISTRGMVDDGVIGHFQVTMKVGFTLDDSGP